MYILKFIFENIKLVYLQIRETDKINFNITFSTLISKCGRLMRGYYEAISDNGTKSKAIVKII